MIEEEKLITLLGNTNVSFDPATLELYARDVSFTNQIRPLAVVKPTSAQQIQQLVQYANETGTPLVPVSSGAPHFKGDTVPGIGGTMVVDLSSMKKILRTDRPRRVAMVEPGVTFGELISEVTKCGIRLNMPLLPRQSKSVVGSMLEREPLLMPKYQWDISDPLACTGIIFGTGDEFRTGQAAGPGSIDEQSAAGGVQKAPYGPGIGSYHRIIQGSQGGMGIVTWASLRCEILPSYEEAFVVGSDNVSVLLDVAAWLIRLRMVNECFILNNTNLAAIFAKKWPGDFYNIKSDLPRWILFYVVAGYEFYPEERVNAYTKEISEFTQRLGVCAAKSTGNISADAIMKMVQKPSTEPYWKLRYKGSCEDIFFLTLNDKIESMIKIMSDTAGKFDYAATDMGVYIQPIVQGTSVHCEFNLFYDPEKMAEVRSIADLSSIATQALLGNGAFFSRPYGKNTRLIVNRDSASMAILKKLKNIFDPNQIMNPGKICW